MSRYFSKRQVTPTEDHRLNANDKYLLLVSQAVRVH